MLGVRCHSFVRPFDASCRPTIHGDKKVRRPFVFKITQQHMNNWEISRLFLQCIVFPTVDVLPHGHARIYNILFDDNQYDVTINNFPGRSCVYFVKMLASALGAHGAYV